MTNPTKQQVLDCNDGRQLSVWAALAQGFTKVPSGNAIETELWQEVMPNDEDEQINRPTFRYSPCSPTVEGESQCFRLMGKYPLSIERWNNEIYWNNDGDDPVPIGNDLQIAIVKASIISEIEK